MTKPQTEPHAVRWLRRHIASRYEDEWTRWHYTLDANFTLCGRPIPAISTGGQLPEATDGEEGRLVITCARCLAALPAPATEGAA